ncbi:MAG: hypothetical protein ABIP54_02050 [Candidatus Andersenbacteria bacterium]
MTRQEADELIAAFAKLFERTNPEPYLYLYNVTEIINAFVKEEAISEDLLGIGRDLERIKYALNETVSGLNAVLYDIFNEVQDD